MNENVLVQVGAGDENAHLVDHGALGVERAITSRGVFSALVGGPVVDVTEGFKLTRRYWRA
jgi:hypothetical protein